MRKTPFIFFKGLDRGKLIKVKRPDNTGKQVTRYVNPNAKDKEDKPSKKKDESRDSKETEFDAIKKELAPSIETHKNTFDETISEMKSAFPDAKVYGRVKDVESASNKVFIRRDQGAKDYKESDIQDLTGTRIESDNISDVLKSVARLRKLYEIIDEDNYIEQPKGIGYRRYHCICKDKNGKVFEVQLGTKNQTIWADWCHDVYKPQTKLQEEVFNKYRNDIIDYATKAAEYFFAKDTGKSVPKVPPCTFEIKQTFGCLPI